MTCVDTAPAAPAEERSLVDEAVRLYEGGWSIRRIAQELPMSRPRVTRALGERGTPQRRAVPRPVYPVLPQWWFDELSPTLLDGVWRRTSLVELADRFGISERTLQRHLDRLGLPRGLTAAVAPPAADAPGEDVEAWIERVTHREGGCRRWVFARDGRVSRRRYPVTYRDGVRIPVNRLVWSWFHGPVEAGHDVIHAPTCAFVDCLEPRHLRSIRVADRIEEQVRRQAHAHGEEHWNAKLSADQARAIREGATEAREPASAVALRYGVSSDTVAAIRSRRRWRHLDVTPDASTPRHEEGR